MARPFGFPRIAALTCLLASPFLLVGALTSYDQIRIDPPPQKTPANPERMRNARIVLKEATQTAGRNPDPAVLAEFVQIWFKMDRAPAPEIIEDIYSQLRSAATTSETLGAYQRQTNSAHALLSSYVSQKPERVAVLLPLWPDPPASLGEAGQQWYAQAKSRFDRLIAPNLVGAAPMQALRLAGDAPARGAADYMTNGRMVMQLNMSGQKDEALKLADQTVASFAQQDTDAQAIYSYCSFLSQLYRLDADRYMRAVLALMPSLEKLKASGSGGTLTVRERTVELTAAEVVLVMLSVRQSGNSDLATKTLQLNPELKSKVDSLGLIENVLNQRPQGAYNLTYSLDGRSGGGMGTLPPGPGSEKYRGMRGRPPAGLAAGGTSAPNIGPRGQPVPTMAPIPVIPEDTSRANQEVNLLLAQARKASVSDPDAASKLLAQAAVRVGQMEPLQSRAIALQQVMSAYGEIEGKPNADLIKEGFKVLAQLAEREKTSRIQPSMVMLGAVSRSYGSGSIDLEASLAADLALFSFDEAMRYVRNMPEDQHLIVLVRILHALSGY
jgi:hypothetical protein